MQPHSPNPVAFCLGFPGSLWNSVSDHKSKNWARSSRRMQYCTASLALDKSKVRERGSFASLGWGVDFWWEQWWKNCRCTWFQLIKVREGKWKRKQKLWHLQFFYGLESFLRKDSTSDHIWIHLSCLPASIFIFMLNQNLIYTKFLSLNSQVPGFPKPPTSPAFKKGAWRFTPLSRWWIIMVIVFVGP